MKIKFVDEESIVFDNGSKISYDHEASCCEWNYADFSQLDSLTYSYNFNENIQFEVCKGGFRFGDERMKFFVPCYSNQSGWYSTDVDIYYNDILVLTCDGEIE